LLVTGARGGPRIISATSQIILNVIDHRMSLSDAVSAPRIHHQSLPDSIRVEKDGLAPAVLEALRRMGHGIIDGGGVASSTSIMRVRGGYEGMGDPRTRGGGAVGF